MGFAAVRVLARPNRPRERTRERLLVAAVAVAGALLLASARIARIGEFRALPALAPFVAQPGLRFGVVLGGVLVVVPVAVFAVQVLRLGSTARERRLAALRLAGAAPAELRRIAALQTGRSGLLGGLLAGPAYLLLWAALGVLPTAGSRLLPAPVAGAMTARRASPRAAWVPRVVVGLVGLLVVLWAVQLSVIFAVGAAALIALVALGTPVTRRVARRMAGRGTPTELLAAARLAAAPRPAGRVAGVLAVCGFALGVQGGLAAGTVTREDAGFYLAGVGIAATATLVAIVVSVLALLVAAADQIVDGRRAVAALSALGADPDVQRRVLRRQLTAVSVPAATAGALLGAVLFGPAGIGTAGAAGLVVALLPVPVAAVLVALLARIAVASLAGLLADAADPENLRAA